MNFFTVTGLLGGLAFFLFGMRILSGSLEKVAGGRLESVLKKMTASPLKALLSGAGITALIQSSSAMTVMLVGLVNSGIMGINQAVGVIMGSNVGTTVTSWLLSLTGIKSDSFFLSLLKPENFSPVLAFIGILLIMSKKSRKRADFGSVLLGFSVLMTGMEAMSSSVESLAGHKTFQSALTAFSNPLLGILAGAVFTAVIQSSTASIGILQALAVTGSISYAAAIPIILGQNIGTCVTPVLSSIGAGKGAKQVAVLHISFNIIGTALFMLIFYGVSLFSPFGFLSDAITPFAIAGFHTVFNIAATLLLLPFSGLLVRLASLIVRKDGRAEQTEYPLLDSRLLVFPHLAVEQCKRRAREMAELAKSSFIAAADMLSPAEAYPKIPTEEAISAALAKIERNERKLDRLEDELGAFIYRLNSLALTKGESDSVTVTLRSIVDFERIGDRAESIFKTLLKMYEKKLYFPEEILTEINKVIGAVRELLELTVKYFRENSPFLSEKTKSMCREINVLSDELKKSCIARLKSGNCPAELGIPLNDLLENLDSIVGHCSSTAESLLIYRNE